MSPRGEIHRFESGHHDHEGFFGEPTSTIDWCERNYEVTYWIAEFWNTISNLSFILCGILGIVQAIRYRYEPRFVLIAIGITLVGFGSSAFHGTLLFEYQMAGEKQVSLRRRPRHRRCHHTHTQVATSDSTRE